MWLNLAVETWQVSVYTGTLTNAGSDAIVYLTIFGNKTSTVSVKTNEMKLENGFNNYKLGTVDVFQIETIKLVKPNKIIVVTDKNGANFDWYFSRVSISAI